MSEISNEKGLHGDEIFGQNPNYIPKYFYVPSVDKYFTIEGDVFDDDDFVAFDRLEREWKNTQKNYSFFELIKIFPEAIKVARRNLKLELKHLKDRKIWLSDWREGCNDTLNKMHKPDERSFYKDHFDEGYNESLAEVESKIKKTMFSLSHLDEVEGKIAPLKTNGVPETDIAKAKEVSILNFVKVNHSGFTKCPLHSEKNASFKYYKDQNTWWCYSCGNGGTVIDLICKLKNINFLEAVKFLIK